MSVALPAPAAGVAVGRARLVDVLLFANVFAITFAKLRWNAGGLDVTISDVGAAAFVAAFAAHRLERRTLRVPRTIAVLLVFFGLFSAVYLRVSRDEQR